MAKKMTRCPKGHLYESDVYSACPHCGVPDLDVRKTRGRQDQKSAQPRANFGQTRPHGVGRERDSPDITRKYYPAETGEPRFDPVVGWLVCVEGKERGKDYRITAEWNYVGRDEKMDICIQGDDSISRQRHAKLNFDPRSNEYRLAPGEAGKNTYLNGRNVMEATRLKAGDEIELGRTKLLFVPLCGNTFTWEAEAGPEVPSTKSPDGEEQVQESRGPGTFVPGGTDKTRW